MTTRWTTALLALVLIALPARAADESDRPWAIGVPKDRQAKAIALFRDGNAALKESLFPKASALYKEALASWDHPAVHYNLALALVNLDQPLEVHEHLTAALKYGPAPLDDDKYQQAQRYLALIERQLTRVTVTCSFAGAQVKLDGKPLFEGPGRWEGQVRAGTHTLTASKEGLLPDERTVVLPGGDQQTFDLKVFRSEELTEYRRAFSPAIPWATLGVGIAAAGAGLGLQLAAQGGFASYDKGISSCASGVNAGCIPTPALQSQREAASGLQTGAYALYAVGGAAIVTSAILFYAGRPIAYRKGVNVEAVSLLPVITPSGGGAVASFEF